MWELCTWTLLTVLLCAASFIYGLVFKNTAIGKRIFGLMPKPENPTSRVVS